ncbi:16S rRNA (guanine(527)-N(7))-methyltransferase RsmG [Oscillospiraceae bacterium 38-13]
MMEAILRQGLSELSLPTDNIPALLRYAELLAEKNKVMNLTAITDPAGVARLHFLDCAALLTLVPFQGKRVVDVGTGAGFPGLPLRILEPSIDLTLLDAQRKRVDFLREVCRELDMEDVRCLHERAEDLARDRREHFDLAVSRAVASLPVLAELCLPLVRVGGKFLAMKSVDTQEELNAAGRAVQILGGRLEKPLDYGISGTNIRHRLVIITKIEKTLKKYPRSFAKIKKNPL